MDLFGISFRGKKNNTTRGKKNNTTLPPINGGRVSEIDEDYSLSSLIAELSLITPDFEFELLKVLEHLSIYNHDVSFAVENIVTLGNTSYKIEFKDDVTEDLQKNLIESIKEFRDTWYPNSDGINALINDLFVQLAITGALSAEIIPNTNLDAVKRVVLLSPSRIRFNYDKKLDQFQPFQLSKKKLANNLIPLNPYTYRYSALRRISEKPYGIPPFLSALENIALEKSMVEDLKHVTKKLGVLGFLKVLVNAPSRRPAEKELAWQTRCKDYLSQNIPEVEKTAKKGFVMGFKGTHEFEMENVSTNVQGAKDLFQLNTEMKMSGLKQDPMMLGRNYSTTETLGRVILAKLGTQIENYQKVIESFLEYTFKMHLQLQGYKIDFLDVKFEKPLIGDRNREEDAMSKKIDNADKLYKAGIISQHKYAQLLGYEKPDKQSPRQSQQPSEQGDAPEKTPEDGDQEPTGENDKKENWKEFLDFRVDDTHYTEGDEGCCGGNLSASKLLDELSLEKTNYSKLLKDYLNNTLGIYDVAIEKSVIEIGKKLKNLGEGVTLEQINDNVIYTLYNGWDTRFTKKQLRVTKDNITHIYKKFRADKSIFKNYKGKVPDDVFNVTDVRSQDYFAKSDELYLGQFITDQDTRKRITEFIKNEHINNNLPLVSNKDPNSLEKFKSKFSNVLQGEDFKIARIINTTVNKMRNYAAVNYMDQAQVTTFEIVGVSDRLQCPYCAGLQGFTFSVTRALSKIQEEVKSFPDLVKTHSPFINSVYKKPEDLNNVSADELQSQGIDSPPFHPRCRDRVIAVFTDTIDS